MTYTLRGRSIRGSGLGSWSKSRPPLLLLARWDISFHWHYSLDSTVYAPVAPCPTPFTSSLPAIKPQAWWLHTFWQPLFLSHLHQKSQSSLLLVARLVFTNFSDVHSSVGNFVLLFLHHQGWFLILSICTPIFYIGTYNFTQVQYGEFWSLHYEIDKY